MDGARIDLAELVEELRRAGFSVDTRQYLAANELLLACARAGVPLETRPVLASYLAPIFCTSPDEQRRFPGIVAQLGSPPPPPPPRAEDESNHFRPWRWLAPGLVVAILALLAAGGLLTLPGVGEPGPTRAVREIPTVPGAPTGYGAALGALAMAALALGTWTLVERLRRRLVLTRLPIKGRPEFTRLSGVGAGYPMLTARSVRRLVAALRQTRAQPASELDAEASAAETARAGGLEMPVFRMRRATPEYVALIERRSGPDHQARLVDGVLSLLQSQGLVLSSYFFGEDLRVCHARGATFEAPPARARRLGDIAARHTGATFLVFAEASTLVEPISGRLLPWTEQLRHANRCALLTPEAPYRWTRLERRLVLQGIAVLPATASGLRSLAEFEDERRAMERLFPAPFARPYPPLLRGVWRWLAPAPPSDRELAALLSQLRGFLGPSAFAWLAACGVYPELEWALTVDLGSAVQELDDVPGRREEALRAIARLPWFRVGSMPEWLRRALIAQLPAEREQAVRARIVARLARLARETHGAVAAGDPQRATTSGHRIGAWIGPLDVIRTSAPQSPLRDAVFAAFVAGRKIDPLLLPAPSALRQLFRRIGKLRLRERPSQRAGERWSGIARAIGVRIARAFVISRDAADTATARPDVPDDRTLFGHPRGLGLLFFVEMWERFSYYGMRALLVLYLVNAVRWAPAQAASLYGTYTMLLYLTPLAGGMLADRFLGTRNAIVLGGTVIAAGHFALALPSLRAFYAGLALIIAGTGLFKPNASTMCGQLYTQGDRRRDAGFTIFYMGVNAGAVLGPLVCGALAQSASFGWHYGFAAAGVGMVLGLLTYLWGRDRYLRGVGFKPERAAPTAVDRGHAPGRRVSLPLWVGAVAGALVALLLGGVSVLGIVFGAAVGGTVCYTVLGSQGEERRRVVALFVTAFFVVFFWAAFEQAGSSMNLFADRNTDLAVGGLELPSSWFQSVNPFLILTCAPLFAGLWGVLGRLGKEPSTPFKMVLGLVLLGVGFLFMVVGGRRADGGVLVSPFWLVAAYAFHTWGELCLSPVGLSYVTKIAPARFAALLMAAWYLANAAANKIAGTLAALVPEPGAVRPSGGLAGFLGGVTNTNAGFYSMFVVSSFAAAAVMLLCVPWLRRMTASAAHH